MIVIDVNSNVMCRFVSSFVLFIWFLSSISFAQQKSCVVNGRVVDENGNPLNYCHVHYQTKCIVANNNGEFSIAIDCYDVNKLTFTHIGFNSKDTLITGEQKSNIVICLISDDLTIDNVLVSAKHSLSDKTKQIEVINKDYLFQNISSSFVKSMDKIPGLNSMDIGAGISKPIIRGLGFSRVSVFENGIKQEGQQWGADHGLEIDPMAVEYVEIIKGASAIDYGSDAVGGVINIVNQKVPIKNVISGDFMAYGKSVNNGLGTSFYLENRTNNLYFKLRGSAVYYGDYHVPTDTILYLTRKIPLYNQKIKNSAGQEKDVSMQVGYIDNRIKSTLMYSFVNQDVGFFPGAHGIPDLNRITDDGNDRNVDYPRQHVTHHKFIQNNKILFPIGNLYVDLGFQQNIRQEWSLFHTHYSGQPPPLVNPDLELQFDLKTYSVNSKFVYHHLKYHEITVGVNNQWKNNEVAGYNFLLPSYQDYNYGVYLKDNYNISPKTLISVGLRYDFRMLKTEHYFDTILYNYYISRITNEQDVRFYATRSNGVEKVMSNLTWSMGVSHQLVPTISIKANIGKTFRAPEAIEFSANGIHHGSFRHETGSVNLSPEIGYYADADLLWEGKHVRLSIAPYLYYFDNYIYLNPTGEWSQLPHAGQIYAYTQSKALLEGIECEINFDILKRIKATSVIELIRNEQIDKQLQNRYPLPFTPPFNGFNELSYNLLDNYKMVSISTISVNHRYAFFQNHIARNELPTAGYSIFGVGWRSRIKLRRVHYDINFLIDNVLDTKYYNHISFYRKLEIPELGRSFQVMLKIPFSHHYE